MTDSQKHFEGLPQWFKMTVFSLSVLIAVTSLSYAWCMAMAASDSTVLTVGDIEILDRFNERMKVDGQNHVGLYAHVFDTMMQLKLLTNHQVRALVAIGGGFAFVALGLALFLIGVEGAFQIQGTGKGSTSLSITASAPGILCFVLAAWLIYVGATRSHSLRIPVLGTSASVNSDGGELAKVDPDYINKPTRFE